MTPDEILHGVLDDCAERDIATDGDKLLKALNDNGYAVIGSAELAALLARAERAERERDEAREELANLRKSFLKWLKERPVAPHPVDQLKNLERAITTDIEIENLASERDNLRQSIADIAEVLGSKDDVDWTEWACDEIARMKRDLTAAREALAVADRALEEADEQCQGCAALTPIRFARALIAKGGGDAIAKAVEAEREACAKVKREFAAFMKLAERALGDHSAPEDCYATGPLTGDPVADLVECPACTLAAAIRARTTELKP